MVRVLQVVTYMGRGGLETMLMNYYRNIDRDIVQFDFLVHRSFEAEYDAEILKMGGHIYHLPTLNPFSISYHKKLNAFFKEHTYDVVHSHLDCMSAYPLAYAKKYGASVRIAHAHNKNQDHNFKYIVKSISRRFMPQYATHLFACSEEAGKWMFGKHQFYVLNNAIDAKRYRFSADRAEREKKALNISNEFVIGHIGRFYPQKNHKFLIEIFRELVKIESDAKLFLVGTGPDRELIREKVKEYHLENKVVFMGSREDIPEILQAIDVFVFPSLYEGLGIAAVEAQAAGIPCILSDQVPVECRMTQNVEFLSLKKSPKCWAESIIKYKNRVHLDNYTEICKSGYDIKENAKKLQMFYQNGSY